MSIQHPGEIKGNRVRRTLDKYVGKGQQTYTPTEMVIEKVKGCLLTTVDGKKLIDFSSGVLVSNLGYAHPKFEKYFKQYMKGLPRNTYNMVTVVQAEASKRLVKSMKKNPKAEKILWAASGSEGVQKAMWTAQHRYPDRPIILATRYGFHGKKGLAGEVTGESSPNPNVRFTSFPIDEEQPQARYQEELDALAAEFPNQIGMLITEPYLGAKGSFHPPIWYHQMLQAWANKHDIPFIFDEVQACFGRTGNLYAFESYEVQPDLVVLGKGMASGAPAAAVIGRADLIDALDYGEGSDTFSGNAEACAAVCATLDVFKEDKIVKQTQKAAKRMEKLLHRLMDDFDFIHAVRGEGLVYGVEIATPELAQRCVLEAYYGNGKKGVHFLGPLADKVLRVSPPLIISKEELQEAEALLRSAWQRI